jgi:RNA 2',3'-cyclic 3'-phosphodiesterase
MSQFRGFIAVDIDVFPKLLEFEKEIKETGANVKLVEPENVHITLKFLGDTNESQIDEIDKIIKDAVKEIDPFNIQLKGTGVFPNQNYIKIIWVGIKQGEPIGVIASKIDEQLSKMGFKKEKRGFSPHLTIARVKSAKGKDEILHVIEKYGDVQFVDIRVDSIKLKKSDLTPKGPIYTTLMDVKL